MKYQDKMSKFKTKYEYEEEDTISYRKRMERVQKMRDLKRAEGFKCKYEGCGQHFEAKEEFEAHCKKHQDDDRRQMRCNKKECKDIKVRLIMIIRS